MIHIATVHYKTDKWIDIQLKYLRENIKQPFRVYAFLCGEAVKHSDKFYYSSTEPIDDHATKLNILADIIYFATESKDEPLIFLDGDAFPIAPLDNYIDKILKEYPLAAIQRLENIGDKQPHPSFCITSPNLWKKINGDWKKGYQWMSSQNKLRSDVGGNLLKRLNEKKIKWGKIHRTSENLYHPVFFGVYGKIIYHHGAGFRFPLTMHDRLKKLNGVYKQKSIETLLNLILKNKTLKNRFRIQRLLGINRKLINKNIIISKIILEKIINYKEEFMKFIKEDNYTL